MTEQLNNVEDQTSKRERQLKRQGNEAQVRGQCSQIKDYEEILKNHVGEKDIDELMTMYKFRFNFTMIWGGVVRETQGLYQKVIID